MTVLDKSSGSVGRIEPWTQWVEPEAGVGSVVVVGLAIDVQSANLREQVVYYDTRIRQLCVLEATAFLARYQLVM